MSFRYLLLWWIVLVGVISCSHPPSPSGPRSVDFGSYPIEPGARVPFFQAEKLYSIREYSQAEKIYLSVKQKFSPKTRAHQLSSYRLATIYYYKDEYGLAAREFEYYLSRFPESELAFDVTYNLAAAQYQLRQFERSKKTLSRLKTSEIMRQGSRRAEVVYQLQAQVAEAMGEPALAIEFYALQLQLPITENARQAALANVDARLSEISQRSEIEKLLNQVKEPTTRSKVDNRIQALKAEWVAKGVTQTQASIPTYVVPDTPEGSESRELPLIVSSQGDRLNIGVILPLTGRSANYGNKALEGILLAARTYQVSREMDLRIFVEDSASSPILAQQGVDTLFYRHRVVAIIGPLSSKEAIAVAERAQQLGVLNLSLAAKEGLAKKGSYLFQNALTPRVQMESLLNYCVREKQFRRFAILAPNDSFGRDMGEQFWSIAEGLGGRIVAHQEYSAGEKDFQNTVKELAGLSNPAKYRKLEWEKLTNYIKETKAKTGKEPKKSLGPIIDYDALFIPDSPRAVAQVAASLAYFDIVGIPLLGTTEWNSDQLARRGGRYLENALFPGGVNLATRNAKQRDFIREYSEAYGGIPDLLAGQSFEAMELVATAMTRSNGDRNTVVEQMTRIRDFESLLGTVSFDSNRVAQRRLSIYALGPGGTVTELD